MVDALIRREDGGLTLRELRAVLSCADTPKVRSAVESRALGELLRTARALRASAGIARRVQAAAAALVRDAEASMAQLGVPMAVSHPALSSALGAPGTAHPGITYADVSVLSRVLHQMAHPSSWAPREADIWTTVSRSLCLSTRVSLALLLSTVLPVECRLCYATLHHAAYTRPGVATLRDMLRSILLKMMTQEPGPADCAQLLRRMRQGGPADRALVLLVLRWCRRGGQRSVQERAEHAACLASELRDLLGGEGAGAGDDGLLYSPRPWLAWLLRRSTGELVSLYARYLYDGFQ